MEAINLSLYQFRLRSPFVYAAIVILLPVLGTYLISFAEKKLHMDGTPLGVLLFGLPAVEAILLSALWREFNVIRLIVLFVGTLCVLSLLLKGLNSFSGKALPKKQFVRLAKKRDYQALEKAFAHDGYNSWSGIEKLNDAECKALAEACLPSKEYGEDFYRLLIPRLDADTVRELLNDPRCNPIFRVCLLDRSPNDARFSDWHAVFDYADKSLTAANILKKNMDKIVPLLTYPAYAKELREIVTGVKKYELTARRKALQMIPEMDQAFQQKYCPYCGSSKIKTGYLGLHLDMYYYGFLCQNCGHRSAAPEGMGEAVDFRVGFRKLVQ